MVSEIEKLSAVAAEKSLLESKFEEVEKQSKKLEAQLKEEVTIIQYYGIKFWNICSLIDDVSWFFFSYRSKKL